MSDNIFILIPTSPIHVPEPRARELARNLLASFLPDAKDVSIHVTDEIEFVDPGANLERILCPNCRSELDTLWWQAAMDHAYESKFKDLRVNVPCCGKAISLNELVYDFPAGFARFALKARNPNSAGINVEQFAQLELILNTHLRKIWAHY